MTHPLQLWKSKEVTNLLKYFYRINFEKAGVEKGISNEIVDLGWEARFYAAREDYNPRFHTITNKINNLFKEARKQAYTGIDEIDLIDLFDFSNINTFLDFGANKFRAINEVGYKNPKMELIAADVTDQQVQFAYPDRSRYLKIEPNDIKLNLPNDSVDIVQFKYVLHHIETEFAIEQIFIEIKRILRPRGRVIVWEETFESNINLEDLCQENKKLGINTHLETMGRFCKLSEAQKWEFIAINDWLINVNNEHMQWTGEYKRWKDWVDQLSVLGLHLVGKYNLGLRLNGKLKQGIHMVGVFE